MMTWQTLIGDLS